jgi:hypothetical protein
MTLEEFAKAAGVSIAPCHPEWGGKIAYTEKDHPHSRVCGFRTEAAAYKHWAETTFGPRTYKALKKLLEPSKRNKRGVNNG